MQIDQSRKVSNVWMKLRVLLYPTPEKLAWLERQVDKIKT